MVYKLKIDVKQTIYRDLFICIKNDFKADSIKVNDEYFVCFNDEYNGNELVKKEVIKLMESLFPTPSQYEI